MSKNHPVGKAFDKLARKTLDKKAHKRAIKAAKKAKQGRKVISK